MWSSYVQLNTFWGTFLERDRRNKDEPFNLHRPFLSLNAKVIVVSEMHIRSTYPTVRCLILKFCTTLSASCLHIIHQSWLTRTTSRSVIGEPVLKKLHAFTQQRRHFRSSMHLQTTSLVASLHTVAQNWLGAREVQHLPPRNKEAQIWSPMLEWTRFLAWV